MPLARAVFMLAPADPQAHAADDQMMLGTALLITPILDQACPAFACCGIWRPELTWQILGILHHCWLAISWTCLI